MDYLPNQCAWPDGAWDYHVWIFLDELAGTSAVDIAVRDSNGEITGPATMGLTVLITYVHWT
ncbi:MAG: hypothetical protein AVDCRST_MAG93-7531 [uncultured Chloroflexia bacterium]|uniref:Uncharacterized protein n=1 Tax=uncultured Chloroflexia bacterium TaxID=1672391 RepID=A0A6J4MM46_9CHLR|nr:MAG: hypothetical protein AVDCRST_MAG93-7531 [uncultured Chloroflexia bacterium]